MLRCIPVRSLARAIPSLRMSSTTTAATATETTQTPTNSGCCPSTMEENIFHKISNETLEYIQNSFQESGLEDQFDDLDVDLLNGVLSIKTSKGTYVINKQAPNRQIWLSSPISGPKRFNFCENQTKWVSKDGKPILDLLSEEIREITGLIVSLDSDRSAI
eukprot:TRINITY_DN13177_c0_g1_i1.p1 TRINITY_DN13177_c0_g1~~TRINITY_DN13177_c0_g1_i1.p1  ORF type:complete len:180 (+),score=63.16 TRINITY_DN13177_c0_g1_i1:59-541(+)